MTINLANLLFMACYRNYQPLERLVIGPAAALLALLALLALSACTSSGHSGPARPPSAQLTPAQARAAFAHFLPAYRSAEQSHSQQAALKLVTGAELPAVQRLPGVVLQLTIPPLTGERFYVPRLTGYPRWFFVTANAPAAREKFFFVLVQAAAGANWREAARMFQLPGYPLVLPDLSGVRLTHGYATAVLASDPSLATPPGELSVGFSDYFDTAISNPRAAPPTGYSSALATVLRSARLVAPRYGWRLIDQLRPAGFPVYALRLGNGGAAVVYATSETFGWQAISAHASLHAPRSVANIGAIPDPFTLHYLKITTVRSGLRLLYEVTDEHLAIDPAVHGGTVADFFNGETYLITKS
jgi:hypothetical protein